MAYSWAETITQYVTTVKASHMNELRTNSNTERGRRGLGNYSWSQTVTQYTTKVLQQDFAEIKQALDEAEAENYCHTVQTCPTYYASNQLYTNTCTLYLATYYNSYRGNNNESGGGCTPYCTSVNTTHYQLNYPTY